MVLVTAAEHWRLRVAVAGPVVRTDGDVALGDAIDPAGVTDAIIRRLSPATRREAAS